jgi:hypothetical protein
VDFDEILYGGDAIQDDLNSTLLKALASTIPKWRTFKLLRWMQRNALIAFESIGGF